MPYEDNAKLARNIYDAFNKGDFERCLSLATEDVEIVLVPFGQVFRGREGFRTFMQGFKTAFPDLTINPTNQVSAEGAVVNEFRAKGTHTGSLFGPAGEIPATGNKIDYAVIEVWGIRDSRLASIRNYFDSATLMQQLGLVPFPERVSGGATAFTASPAENKVMVRRLFEEGINRGSTAVIQELIGPSYVNHDFPTPVPGPEGFKQMLGMFRSGFPDLRVDLHDVLAEGDKAASRGTWHGTHQGEFMGIPATGKRIAVTYTDIWRFENGKLVENWVQMDLMGLMQQLGVAPAPGPASK